MEQELSNREIKHMFADLKENLEKVLAQTTATNGKVAEIQRWRERVIGASQVVMIVVIPILAWALYTIVTIRDTIDTSVDTALKNYEFEVINDNK